jgi:hypothetical protein
MPKVTPLPGGSHPLPARDKAMLQIDKIDNGGLKRAYGGE